MASSFRTSRVSKEHVHVATSQFIKPGMLKIRHQFVLLSHEPGEVLQHRYEQPESANPAVQNPLPSGSYQCNASEKEDCLLCKHSSKPELKYILPVFDLRSV
jgi:hypothetical protein